MECRSLTPDELPLWDDFVETQPHGMLFHTTSWLRCVAPRFEVLGCFSGAGLVAGMPVAIRTRRGVTAVYQPPLTPCLGIVATPGPSNPAKQNALAKELAASFAAEIQRRFDAAAVQFSPEWRDLHGFMWSGFSTAVRYTYRVSLGNLDTIWNDMDPRRRNDIRRAEKEGFTIRRTDVFGDVAQLVDMTFRRQGLAAGFIEVARSLHAALSPKGRCAAFLAYPADSQEPCAVVYLVWDSRRAWYLLGGYDEARTHGGAHALAMWEAIRHAASLGLEVFDFEGSDVPQLERYVRKYGGRITPYYRVTWANGRARAVDTVVETLRGVRRLLKGKR